jgi:hypothetical protein
MKAFIIITAALSIAGFLYSARSLRRLLHLLFFLSLFEGVYINYFYPAQLPLLLKDFLVGYIYLVFLAQGHLREALRRTGSLLLPMAVYATIYLVHVFNPLMNNVLVGLVGLRVAIFYLPLILVAQVAFRSDEELWRFLKFGVLLAIPVCAYGIYQWFGGAEHIASLGTGYIRRGVAILYGGGRGESLSFRTLSTFTYSSSFSIFLLLIAPFSWILVRSQLAQAWRHAAVAATVLLLAAQLSTGGRQALVYTLLLLVLTELFYGRGLLKKLVAPAVIALGLYAGLSLMGKGVLDRFETIFDAAQVEARYRTYFVRHNLDAIQNSPLGHGSGTAAAAARHVGRVKFHATETAFSRIVYETGLPGVAAFFWLLVSLLRRCQRTYRHLADRQLTSFTRAFFVLGVIVTLTSLSGWPLDLPPLNALFWVFAGIALATPYLDRAPEVAFEPAPRRAAVPAAAVP